jgi:hypothetical protein
MRREKVRRWKGLKTHCAPDGKLWLTAREGWYAQPRVTSRVTLAHVVWMNVTAHFYIWVRFSHTLLYA